jgi:PAS domain S-box-containing protein
MFGWNVKNSRWRRMIGSAETGSGDMMTDKSRAKGRRRQPADPSNAPTQPRNPLRNFSSAVNLASVVENLPTGVLIEDPAGIIRYLNPEFCRIMQIDDPAQYVDQPGEKIAQAIRSNFRDPADFIARTKAMFAAQQIALLQEFDLANGGCIIIEFIPIVENGQIANYFWHYFDITERKQAERESQATHQKIQRLLDYAPVILFELDIHGTLLQLEGKTPTVAGLRKEDIVGANAQRLLSLMSEEQVQSLIDKALLAHAIQGEQTELELEIGGMHYEARITPAFDAAGNVQAIFGVAIDVTERYRTQEKLRRSEERYRAIIENIEDGYYEVDLRGNFTFVNESLCQIVGFSREQLLHRGYSGYTDAATAEMLRETFNHVFRTGEAVPAIEINVMHSSETYIPVEISVRRIDDVDDQPIGFRGIVRDITARKAAEAAIQKRMNLLAVLQQVNTELSKTLDFDMILSVALTSAMFLSDANAGLIAFLEKDHLRIARSIGYVVEGTLTPKHRVSIKQGVMGRAARTGQPQLVQDVTQDPDYVEARRSTRAQISIPLIVQDEIIGVLTLESNDRRNFTPEVFEFLQVLVARVNAGMEKARLYETAQKQVRELQALNAQLSELEQIKTDMIRVAAHDVRSPLGIISGFLGVLRADLDGMLDADQRGYFDTIDRAVERIARISKDILSLERIEAQIQGERQIFNLKTAVLTAVDDARMMVSMHNQTLELNLPDTPICVDADRSVLAEAIANLFGNAIKYTPDGGKITVRLFVEDTQAVLEIEDTGYGIPAELQDRLFQPFYRAKSKKTREIEGTGLGLYLVKKIVETYGGRIRFHSTDGVGSMFGFEMPVNPQSEC